MDGLVVIGAEVLGRLTDEQAGNQTAQHRPEQPDGLVVALAVPHEEDHKDGDDLDARSQIGAAVERLMELGALLGAHCEQTDDRGDDAAGRDHDGNDDRPRRIDGTDAPEVPERAERDGEDGRSQDGAGVGFEQVGTHAGYVAHVVAHVVGDGCGITGVIFGDARLDFTHEVGAHVGSLRVDAAAHTGEERHGGSTGGEAFDHADVLVHEFERINAEHEHDEPQRQAQKRERSHGKTHGETRFERDVQGLRHALLGRVGGTGVGARRHMHADVAGKSRKDAARNESDGGYRRKGNGHNDGYDHHEYDEQLVLAHQKRFCTLLDLQRDVVHLFGTRILFQDP